MLSPTMSAHDLHNQLLELRAERALAEETGVAHIRSYMDDLERDIAEVGRKDERCRRPTVSLVEYLMSMLLSL